MRSVGGLDLRPTSDRLRETLFDVLTGGEPARLYASVWLDLYAGTGAVGIEALSRGAHAVYFVESSKKAAALIRQNLAALGVEAASFEILSLDVGKASQKLEAKGVTCDYCFLDPPYRMQEAYAEALGLLAESKLLKPASIVIAEHEKRFDPGEAFGKLMRYRKLRQSDAALSFYRLSSLAERSPPQAVERSRRTAIISTIVQRVGVLRLRAPLRQAQGRASLRMTGKRKDAKGITSATLSSSARWDAASR